MTDSREPVQPAPDYLQALIAEHSTLREGQQTADQVIVALISVSVALMGTLGAFLVGSCQVSHGSVHCEPSMPRPLYAALPLGPLIILSLLGVLANISTLRSYYLRAIEQEIQDAAASPDVRWRGGAPIRLPAFGQLVDGVISQRRGLARYRVLNLLIYVSIGIVFVGTATFCLLLTDPVDLRIIMACFYAGSTVLLIRVLWAGSVGGLAFWREATVLWEASQDRAEPESKGERDGRTLFSYLLLPRPADLLVKGWIVPLTWLLTTWLADGDRDFTARSVIAFTLVFELLLYQARYIVNDLRGLGIDDAHSSFKRRMRFPLPAAGLHILAAVLTVVMRLALVVWLATRAFEESFGFILGVATGTLVAQTLLYEAMRERVSPKVGPSILSMTPGRAAILVIVGTGYAIRACFGLFLGLPEPTDSLLLLMTALGMTALGSMVVAMTWAIDGVTQIVPHEEGALPTDRYRSSLENLTHIAPLLRQARLLATHHGRLQRTSLPSPAEKEGDPLQAFRVLEPISSLTWWNTMFFASTTAMTVLGLRFSGATAGWTLVSAVVGVVASFGLVKTYGWTLGSKRKGSLAAASSALAPLIGGGIILGAIAYYHAQRPSLLAAIPFVLVGATYIWFRHASLADIQFDPTNMMRAIKGTLLRGGFAVARIIVGKEASARLRRFVEEPGEEGKDS